MTSEERFTKIENLLQTLLETQVSTQYVIEQLGKSQAELTKSQQDLTKSQQSYQQE
jgi:hypothetical protein